MYYIPFLVLDNGLMMVMNSPSEETYKVAEFQFCSGSNNKLCLVHSSWKSRGVERAGTVHETPMYYDTLLRQALIIQ